MSPWPIFEVYMQEEKGYAGRGGIRAPWLRQTAADTQLRDVLKDIPEDAQERRRRESGRRDGGRYQQGVGNGNVMEGDGTEAWRWATLMWAEDPVMRQNGSGILVRI